MAEESEFFFVETSENLDTAEDILPENPIRKRSFDTVNDDDIFNFYPVVQDQRTKLHVALLANPLLEEVLPNSGLFWVCQTYEFDDEGHRSPPSVTTIQGDAPAMNYMDIFANTPAQKGPFIVVFVVTVTGSEMDRMRKLIETYDTPPCLQIARVDTKRPPCPVHQTPIISQISEIRPLTAQQGFYFTNKITFNCGVPSKDCAYYFHHHRPPLQVVWDNNFQPIESFPFVPRDHYYQVEVISHEDDHQVSEPPMYLKASKSSTVLYSNRNQDLICTFVYELGRQWRNGQVTPESFLLLRNILRETFYNLHFTLKKVRGAIPCSLNGFVGGPMFSIRSKDQPPITFAELMLARGRFTSGQLIALPRKQTIGGETVLVDPASAVPMTQRRLRDFHVSTAAVMNPQDIYPLCGHLKCKNCNTFITYTRPEALTMIDRFQPEDKLDQFLSNMPDIDIPDSTKWSPVHISGTRAIWGNHENPAYWPQPNQRMPFLLPPLDQHQIMNSLPQYHGISRKLWRRYKCKCTWVVMFANGYTYLSTVDQFRRAETASRVGPDHDFVNWRLSLSPDLAFHWTCQGHEIKVGGPPASLYVVKDDRTALAIQHFNEANAYCAPE